MSKKAVVAFFERMANEKAETEEPDEEKVEELRRIIIRKKRRWMLLRTSHARLLRRDSVDPENDPRVDESNILLQEARHELLRLIATYRRYRPARRS